MKYSEISTGRVFVLRLETGEMLHEVVEEFSRTHGIRAATLTAVGGIGPGSKLTVGPKLPVEEGIIPLTHVLNAPYELTASGTLFEDEDGNPMIHMHGSAGREGNSVTGCLRTGVIAWLVLEVVITELVGNVPIRKRDLQTGMKILNID